jgi:hypothetical protein
VNFTTFSAKPLVLRGKCYREFRRVNNDDDDDYDDNNNNNNNNTLNLRRAVIFSLESVTESCTSHSK